MSSDVTTNIQSKVERPLSQEGPRPEEQLSALKAPHIERVLEADIDHKAHDFVHSRTVNDIVRERVDRVGNDIIQNSLYDALFNLGALRGALPERKTVISNRYLELIKRINDVRESVIVQRVMHGDIQQGAKERERLIKNRRRRKDAGLSAREKLPNALSKIEIMDFLAELKSEIVNFADLEDQLLEDLLRIVSEVENLADKEE